MELAEIPLLEHQRNFLNRFISACQSDERVVAVLLTGSYVTRTADAHSDVDLGLIVTDEAHDRFCAEKAGFLRRLGELVFVEDWGKPHVVFFILSDATEGEIRIGSENQLDLLHQGPHTVLLDKIGILAGVDFPYEDADPSEQIALLRSIINGFWHDLSHFITAMARGQLWWAYGQLEALRQMCVQLARLRHNFLDSEAGDEAYFKIDKVLSAEHLSPLEMTYPLMEQHAMLQASQIIVKFYQERAQALAQTHDIAYPDGLEAVILKRLEKLFDEQSSEV
jgi:predicted nucleotidyltransferase